MVDDRNYHLFTPLLYQVASCLLAPAEIATPLRTLFRHAPNVRYRQGRVVHVDTDAKSLTLADDDVLIYDALVLATGSTTNYYGKADVEAQALGLKDLGEALRLRNHVLTCLERAVIEPDGDDRRRHLTFCVVGGGPTGVEYAGALAELVRLVLPREYPRARPPRRAHRARRRDGPRAPHVPAAPLGVRAEDSRTPRRGSALQQPRRVGRRPVGHARRRHASPDVLDGVGGGRAAGRPAR